MFRSRLSLDAFSLLLRLFAENVESYRIADEVDVSRVTVSRILNALRHRMAAYSRCLEPFGRVVEFPDELLARANPRHLRGRRPTSELPVAALHHAPPEVACELVCGFPRALWRYLDLEVGALEAIGADNLFGDAVALLDLQTFELISLIPPREQGGVRFRADEMRAVEEFAEFSRALLQRVRGVPGDKLWLYLAEAEFRFNRRDRDLTAVLLGMLRMEPLRLGK